MHLQKENTAAPAAGPHVKSSTLAMGSLLADMNHDIRTSMNGVRGMLELLLDTGLTPSQQEYARTARHNVDNLLESLERIVDMSLIETNSFRFNEAPFDLLQEVRVALAGKQANADGKGIALSIAYPPSLRLLGDGARLREALSALADLALHSAAGERLSLTVSARRQPAGICRVVLDASVPRLSGDGERLASMMSGTAPAQNDVAPKDLLGMAVCMQLVQMMKGMVTIRQATPPATVFRLAVDLPLSADAPDDIRMLVLAEHVQFWNNTLASLFRPDLRVDYFESALEGLAAIESAANSCVPYRIILLGRHVQGMDASVLSGIIKGNPAHRNALLVLLEDTSGAAPDHDEGFSAILRASSAATEVESILASLGNSTANILLASAPRSGPAHAPKEANTGYAGLTVLVADDNPVNQQVAARMVEKLGCKAEVAADGMQAIDMHAYKRFDLILMDCEMPVLDGLEATERIRAAEGSSRRTPIIALTASTGQGEQERCLAAGMDDFLSKPIRPQILADVLARWLPRPVAEFTEASPPNCEDELADVKEMFGADFAELATLYQNDGPPRLAAMREAAAAGDCAKVAKLAHAFGGSSASIGATGMSSLCKTVEIAAKAGSLEDFDKRMMAIDSEYRRICGKLQSLLTQ